MIEAGYWECTSCYFKAPGRSLSDKMADAGCPNCGEDIVFRMSDSDQKQEPVEKDVMAEGYAEFRFVDDQGNPEGEPYKTSSQSFVDLSEGMQFRYVPPSDKKFPDTDCPECRKYQERFQWNLCPECLKKQGQEEQAKEETHPDAVVIERNHQKNCLSAFHAVADILIQVSPNDRMRILRSVYTFLLTGNHSVVDFSRALSEE